MAALDAQGATVETGDFLCLYTGFADTILSMNKLQSDLVREREAARRKKIEGALKLWESAAGSWDHPAARAYFAARGIPLVADLSSTILSRPIDVSQFGVIYAGAQKNIGPSGLTLVIVREDLLGHALPATPDAFNYKIQADAGSMYNTPPTYAIYIAGLVFKHLKAQGGLAAVEAANQAKAKVLYDFLDASRFFGNPIAHSKSPAIHAAFAARHSPASGTPRPKDRSATGSRCPAWRRCTCACCSSWTPVRWRKARCCSSSPAPWPSWT